MAEEVKTAAAEGESGSKNFIDAFIEEDIAEGGRFQGQQVHTRFPPEPNGYLHIGHAKAICIDFSTAEKYGGECNLRLDDTNPSKEDVEYVDAIKEDIEWLGYKWNKVLYASSYFDFIYECAIKLIKKGKAYVCDLSADEIREYRGTLTEPGKNSPYRDRPIEESLDLFERMKNGEFADGTLTLRAKIDMSSPNICLRDPTIYRVLHKHHHQTGDKWCIYPMYDFAHPIQDALEGITHSLCSLEFEAHRPLYDWVVNNVSVPCKPRQIEFARLGIDHTVMSKRKLRKLVEEGIVSGWDDPRMPTLCGLRRRGFTPASIRNFCDRIGVAKSASVVEYSFLEHCLREDLNEKAERTMGVLHPVKLVITNYPEGKSETVTVENNPTDPASGTHEITFSRECWIEADDFMEVPVPKYKRLTPNGPECRLKGAYLITCTGCKKDENGNVVELICSVDLDSKSGSEGANRKVKGTLHWVSEMDAIPAEVRLYEPILKDEAAAEETETEDGEEVETAAPKDFIDLLNPDSLTTLTGCLVEPAIAESNVGDRFQFLRMGYFCKDPDSTSEKPVFNRVVPLKDSWAKAARN